MRASPFLRTVAGLAAGALLLGACTRVGGGGGRASGTVPHVLRIADSSEPVSLNPLLSSSQPEVAVNRLSFDLLVTADEKGDPVPALAAQVPTTENGGISRDGLTVVYHLRHGVLWQDGAPFTSRDVAFSYRAVMNERTNVVSRHGYDVIRSVETPDPYTVRFHLKRVFAPFVTTVFGESDSPYAIVPEHLLARYPDLNHVPFNTLPIGTGPFRVVKWVRGDRVELVRNDRYFFGKPKLERVTVRIVPDENTEALLLRTHQVDWILETSENLSTQLASEPGVRVVRPQQNAFIAVMFNNAHKPLDDVRVRRGLTAAIDRDALIRNVMHNTAKRATMDLPAFLWAFDPAAKPQPYDPAAARALLAQAGYGPQHRLKLDFARLSSSRSTYEVLLQSALRPYGIDITIKPYPGTLYFGTVATGGIVNGGKFDLTMFAWSSGVDPDDSSLFSCNQFPPAGNNSARYCSAAMDAAQADALRHYDRPSRKRAYARIEELLARDVPLDFVASRGTNQVLSTDFTGFAPNPVTEAANAYLWDI